MTTTTTHAEAKPAEAKPAARDKAATSARPDGKTAGNAAAETLSAAMEAATSGFWQRMMAFNGEAARLAERRASHYREYFGELACCQSPVDAGQAAARATQKALEDYTDELGRLSEIAMSGAFPDRNSRTSKR